VVGSTAVMAEAGGEARRAVPKLGAATATSTTSSARREGASNARRRSVFTSLWRAARKPSFLTAFADAIGYDARAAAAAQQEIERFLKPAN
jgi:hypothetical protein